MWLRKLNYIDRLLEAEFEKCSQEPLTMVIGRVRNKDYNRDSVQLGEVCLFRDHGRACTTLEFRWTRDRSWSRWLSSESAAGLE